MLASPTGRVPLSVILSSRSAASELHGLGRRSVVAPAPPRDLVPPTTKAHAKTERVILSAKRSGAVELRAEAMERCGRIAPCGISFPPPRKPSGRGTREPTVPPLPRYPRGRPLVVAPQDPVSPHAAKRSIACGSEFAPRFAHAQDGTKVKTLRGSVFIRGVTKIGSRRTELCSYARRPYFRKGKRR